MAKTNQFKIIHQSLTIENHNCVGLCSEEFCGKKATGPCPADSDWWIECEVCEIVMDNDSKSELIKAWNKRTI